MKRAAKMRKLLILLLIAPALWSGYWFAGSGAIRSAAEQWFADQTRAGMVAENTSLKVAGFPNRFDLTVEGIHLADPQSGFGWQAPFAQIFAMTWKPWHIIAALPPEQVISTPDEEITLKAEGLMASLRARPTPDLPLAAVIVESGPFTATSTTGWTVGALRALASIKSVTQVAAKADVDAVMDDANTYIMSLDIEELAPDPTAMERIVAEAGLPPVIDAIRLLGSVQLTAPLDRHMGDSAVTPVFLNLDSLLVIWGELEVTASGKVAPDAAGFAAGRIEFEVTNWQKLVPAMVATGAIKPEISKTVENMLGAMAKETGDPDVLKLPLILNEGRMSLGPLPLGPAPMLLPPTG
jgi:hypothetical protein